MSQKQLIEYKVPKQAKEILVCAYIETGGNGHSNQSFEIVFDSLGVYKYKHYMFGHTFDQSAWSYNSEQFSMPVSDSKSMAAVITGGSKGNNGLTLFLIAYR